MALPHHFFLVILIRRLRPGEAGVSLGLEIFCSGYRLGDTEKLGKGHEHAG